MSSTSDPGGTSGRIDWEGEPDLTALSEEELGRWLEKLVREEREISYRRRTLQGRIDLLRAELVRRGGGRSSLSAEELARVLSGEPPEERREGW